MSLLLDALRRASARRDDPLAERLDVRRHAPAVDEDAAAAPPASDAESSAAESGVARSEDELALVPEADERPAPESHADDGTQPAGAAGASQAQSGQRERAAAAALLHAGAGRGRGRGTQLLGLTLAVLVVSAALAGGGWLWHMQSQQDIDTALGGYRPEPAQQAELAANSGPTGPDSQPQASSNPALGGQSTQSAADSSADAAAGPAPADSSAAASSADSGSDSAAPAAPSAPQDTSESDAQGDGASATVEATDNRPPAEPEEQLAQAAAQLAGGGAPATNGAAPAAPGSAQGSKAGGGDAAASAGETASAGDAADAGGGSGSASSDGGARDLVETSGRDGGSRQSPATPSAAPRPPRPMVKQADSAPLEEALTTGYRALGAGDLNAAERAYARARRLAPDNRDALLGAAAVRQRQGDAEAARRLYRQVLDAYPRDPHAQAAMAALDAGATRRNETTLKTLLRDNPNAPALHYALGNVYATESRWSEARMAYARAARIAPDDPDYAYNLAVALDHLGRREAARRTYAQALSLASGAAADFDPAAVRRRLQQLR